MATITLSTSGTDADETLASGDFDLDVDDALTLEDLESLVRSIFPCFGLVLGAMVFSLVSRAVRVSGGVSPSGGEYSGNEAQTCQELAAASSRVFSCLCCRHAALIMLDRWRLKYGTV